MMLYVGVELQCPGQLIAKSRQSSVVFKKNRDVRLKSDIDQYDEMDIRSNRSMTYHGELTD